MKIKRVAIYGGTDLNPATGGFVRLLATALLEGTDSVLVTGGYDYREDAKTARSTDRSVADAAETFAGKHNLPLDTRLETWLPEEAKDRIAEKVHRFQKGKVLWLEGGTRKRRLKIVNDVDALLTIKGRTHTALVLDMALAIGRPALPLPFTGGDSEEFWGENKAYYQMRFGLSTSQAAEWEALPLEDLGDESTESALRVRDEVVQAVSRVLKRSCLVLMPFRPELDKAYKELEQAVGQETFEAIRLDHKLYTGDIRTTVKRLLEEADAIIADVTEASPNVLYELGHAHASERNPLLIWRTSAGSKPEIPFYLKPQRLTFVHSREDLAASIAEYFEGVRSGRR